DRSRPVVELVPARRLDRRSRGDRCVRRIAEQLCKGIACGRGVPLLPREEMITATTAVCSSWAALGSTLLSRLPASRRVRKRRGGVDGCPLVRPRASSGHFEEVTADSQLVAVLQGS